METKYVLDKLRSIAKEAEEKQVLVKRWERNARQNTLNLWANEYHRFNSGDIIRSGNIIIRIDGYYGCEYREKLYITYQGHALTKALNTRADEWVTCISDDGREIEKIK